MKPDKTVDLEKGYYHGFYFLLNFKNEDGVNRKQYPAEIQADMDEDYMKDARINDGIECHWRMVLKDNERVQQ